MRNSGGSGLSKYAVCGIILTLRASKEKTMKSKRNLSSSMKSAFVRLFSTVAVCFFAHGVWSAQFQPTQGGYLDVPDNWNSPGDRTYAIMKQQSAALTVLNDNATLPNREANLSYRSYVYTNDFGIGRSLNLSGALEVQSGASLVQKSGTLATATEIQSSIAGSVMVEGQGSVFKPGLTTISGSVAVSNGGVVRFTSEASIECDARVIVENAEFFHDTVYDDKIFIKSGGVLNVKDSTFTFVGNKGKLSIAGGLAVFDGTEIIFGSHNTAHFGGSQDVRGGIVRFEGSPSSINHRFQMYGDGFEFCVSNTTVTFSPQDATELFITGSGLSDESCSKTFRFCGAAPRLDIASSSGFHLRGTKGVSLVFEIGKTGFPQNTAVIEITRGGSFKGDAIALAASKIVVSVDESCPPGAYILLKGQGATTFLDGSEQKYVFDGKRVKMVETLVDGIPAVLAVVKKRGFFISVR